MTTYVALLRGINLGATRPVAMSDLRKLLEDLGCTDVRTHLRSGNAVFAAAIRSASAVEKQVEGAISETLGMDVRVAVRTSAEMAAVVAADPFAGVVTDPSRYLVTFLEKTPPSSWLASVDPELYRPEQAAVVGRQLYLWLPHGVHTSKLARTVTDRKLGGSATSRNWRVVTRLADLAATG